MVYIKQITIKPSEAIELEALGFVLEFKMMHLDGTDTYEVYVKGE